MDTEKDMSRRAFLKDSIFWMMTSDQIRQCVDLGAYIEYCYLPCLWGENSGMPQYERQSTGTFADLVRVSSDRGFISTDLGQSAMPHPIAGMRQCLTDLQEAGFTSAEINRLLRDNPAMLVGLNN